jgi:hypothetical protein
MKMGKLESHWKNQAVVLIPIAFGQSKSTPWLIRNEKCLLQRKSEL